MAFVRLGGDPHSVRVGDGPSAVAGVLGEQAGSLDEVGMGFEQLGLRRGEFGRILREPRAGLAQINP